VQHSTHMKGALPLHPEYQPLPILTAHSSSACASLKVKLARASSQCWDLGGVVLLAVVQDGELNVLERAHNVLEKRPRAYRAALVAYVLLPVGVDLDKVRELLLPLLGHTIAQLIARDLLGVVVAPVVNQVDPPQLEVVERLALEAVLNSSSTATLTRLVLVAGGLGGRFESR
jgi:hypothetical protein